MLVSFVYDIADDSYCIVDLFIDNLPTKSENVYLRCIVSLSDGRLFPFSVHPYSGNGSSSVNDVHPDG